MRFNFCEEYCLIRFKNSFDLYRGSSPRPIVEYITKNTKDPYWIKIGDMPEIGNFVNSANEHISIEGSKKSRAVFVGDMILSNSMSFGKPYILNINGFIHDGWFVIRNYQKTFERDYLRYLLASPSIQKRYSQIASGGVVLNISSELVNSVSTYIPKKEEQIKISTFLTKIDERIDTQSKIIKDLETFKTLIIDKLLTKNYFDELSIKDLIKFNYARIIKPSEMKEFQGEKLYLSTSSIDKNGIVNFECNISYYNRPSRASMVPFKNSVWFAKMKDTIKVYKSKNDDETKYILSTGFYGLLCNENKINSDWLLEIFRSNYFNNQKNKFSEGSSMSGIKDNQLEDIKIKIFKDRQMESYNVKFFNLLNKKIYIENNLVEKYKEQKKYLLSNMFI